jgi:hypothetical protein
MQLDTSLQFINIRQHLKNSIELQIPISDVIKPIIPSITLDIIKAKKQMASNRVPKSAPNDRHDILDQVSKSGDQSNGGRGSKLMCSN